VVSACAASVEISHLDVSSRTGRLLRRMTC
jgi:hypothetical protein